MREREDVRTALQRFVWLRPLVVRNGLHKHIGDDFELLRLSVPRVIEPERSRIGDFALNQTTNQATCSKTAQTRVKAYLLLEVRRRWRFRVSTNTPDRFWCRCGRESCAEQCAAKPFQCLTQSPHRSARKLQISEKPVKSGNYPALGPFRCTRHIRPDGCAHHLSTQCTQTEKAE